MICSAPRLRADISPVVSLTITHAVGEVLTTHIAATNLSGVVGAPPAGGEVYPYVPFVDGSNSVFVVPPQANEIRLTEEGAAADFGRLKVKFSGDAAATKVVDVTTSEGKLLSFRASFLVMHDLQSDEMVLVAQATNSIGQIVSPTRITYPNAFDA